MKAEGSSGQQQLVILAMLRHRNKCADAENVSMESISGGCPRAPKSSPRDVQRVLDILVSQYRVKAGESKSAHKTYAMNRRSWRRLRTF